MSTADTYVRARIDSETKARASDALEAMGLSISDAIRLLMLRIADERRLLVLLGFLHVGHEGGVNVFRRKVLAIPSLQRLHRLRHVLRHVGIVDGIVQHHEDGHDEGQDDEGKERQTIPVGGNHRRTLVAVFFASGLRRAHQGHRIDARCPGQPIDRLWHRGGAR